MCTALLEEPPLLAGSNDVLEFVVVTVAGELQTTSTTPETRRAGGESTILFGKLKSTGLLSGLEVTKNIRSCSWSPAVRSREEPAPLADAVTLKWRVEVLKVKNPDHHVEPTEEVSDGEVDDEASWTRSFTTIDNSCIRGNEVEDEESSAVKLSTLVQLSPNAAALVMYKLKAAVLDSPPHNDKACDMFSWMVQPAI